MGAAPRANRKIETLQDIKKPADFKAFYAHHRLPDGDDQAKINFLLGKLKIRKSRSERQESLKERLGSLEEFVLLFPEHCIEQS
jgi:hypothetical protein